MCIVARVRHVRGEEDGGSVEFIGILEEVPEQDTQKCSHKELIDNLSWTKVPPLDMSFGGDFTAPKFYDI